MTPKPAGDLQALAREQARSLARDGSRPIRSATDAERFLARVGVALRYGPAKTLPLASLFEATREDDEDGPNLRAADVTNHLLERKIGIEVTVVAGRVSMVHRDVMPSLYALVRRGRPIDDLTGLSLNARTAYKLIQKRHEVTAGDVRHALGLKLEPRHDPGYEALAELRNALLVDRGPYLVQEKGIHYLPKEGYPNHLFHEAHPDLVRASAGLATNDAADTFLRAYFAGALFCPARTLKAMFKLFLNAEEIDASLARLDGSKLRQQHNPDRARRSR